MLKACSEEHCAHVQRAQQSSPERLHKILGMQMGLQLGRQVHAHAQVLQLAVLCMCRPCSATGVCCEAHCSCTGRALRSASQRSRSSASCMLKHEVLQLEASSMWPCMSLWEAWLRLCCEASGSVAAPRPKR